MSFNEIFALSLGAILTENFIFAKLLGVGPFLGVSNKTDAAAGMSLTVIFVMTAASAVTYFVNQVLVSFGLEYLRTVAFVLVAAALVQLVEMFMIKAMPAMHKALGIYLPLAAVNCAVLGVAILGADQGLGFAASVLYAAAAAIGFALALMLFASIRERLELTAQCPEAFEGFPIALVTASLLALAFMGFQGMKIF